MLVNLCEIVCELNGRGISVLSISPKPEVVSSIETVPDTPIHCIEVEYEVDSCEFNYMISAIFPLPVLPVMVVRG